MSERELTCVLCPKGCPLLVEVEAIPAAGGEVPTEGGVAKPRVTRIEGRVCERGRTWARQEVENPMRTIASSVPVRGGDYLLASVRTTRPIPLAEVRKVMAEIRKLVLDAPVEIGDLVLASPAGCDTEVVATRAVARTAGNLSSPRS